MDRQSVNSRSLFRVLLFLIAAIVLGLSILLQEPPKRSPADLTNAELETMHPIVETPEGHASAADCRECHRHNHDSWHASYHRTMTQLVTPQSASANFDNVRIDMPGVREKFLLHRREGMPWVTFDQNVTTFPVNKLQRKEFPLVMSTGSHHLQYYWAPMGRGRTMAQLPVVYLFEAKRWIPVNASFITPQNRNAHGAGSTWNESCYQCHATYPSANHQGDFLDYDTTVVDFGIACESCHGPGAEHIRLHRENKPTGPAFEDPIVNPANLTAELSAQVCGGCHSVFDQDPWRAHEPGRPLAENRRLKTRQGMYTRMRESAPNESDADSEKARLALASWFWPDGMSRVTGREYNNLLESTCHTQGGMSCLDCHRLHQDKDDPRPIKEWASDQLHYERTDDASCLKCHAPDQYASPAHTHHTAASTGSRCYNCHMPHTSYGLLQAIRTHTISRPDTAVTQATGRPNACNLCHTDQTLAWTADHLHRWYQIDRPDLDEADHETSHIVRLLLEGDAAQRALSAWTISWPPATAASGNNWTAPFLATLLQDPYPAVRYMAARSLRRTPGFADFEFDFLADHDRLTKASAAALDQWQTNRPVAVASHGDTVMLDPQGRLQKARLKRHLAQRDDRPIVMAE